jgi:hypothetical protein
LAGDSHRRSRIEIPQMGKSVQWSVLGCRFRKLRTED